MDSPCPHLPSFHLQKTDVRSPATSENTKSGIYKAFQRHPFGLYVVSFSFYLSSYLHGEVLSPGFNVCNKFFFFLWSVHIAFFPPRQLEDTVKVDTAHVFSQGAHGSNRLVLPHWGCLPQSCGNLTLQCFHNIVIWVELHGCIKLSMDNLHTRKLHLQRNVRGHLSRNFQVAWADGANGTDRRRGAASTGTVSPGRRAAATVLRTPWHRDDTRGRENTENKYREVRRNWDRRGDRISLIPG